MDHETFDRISAALAGAANRRTGLKAAAGALIGAWITDAAAKRRREHEGGQRDSRGHGHGHGHGHGKGRSRGPSSSGPCKSTRRKDNVCAKDSECCTGWCDVSKAETNVDGRGRCRYLRVDMACKSGQKCARKLACIDGRCSRKRPAPTGARCAAGSGCADPGAVCTAYTGAGAPSGEFCSLPLGAVCTGDPDCTCYSCATPNAANSGLDGPANRADRACCGRTGIACARDRDCCTGWTCDGGACAAAGSGIPTGDPCVAGDRCADAAASCTSYVTATPPGTFCLLSNAAACTGANDCASQFCRQDVCEARATCTVCQSCTYQTVQAAITALQGGATMQTVYIDAGDYAEDLTVTGKIELRACNGAAVTLRNGTATSTRSRTIVLPDPGSGTPPELVLTDIAVTAKTPLDPSYGGGGIKAFGKVTLSGTTSVSNCNPDSYDSYGGGVHMAPYGELTMNDTATISSNIAGSGGGVKLDSYGKLTMNDESAISDNSVADSYGAGVHVSTRSTIVLNDKAAIKNNDSPYAGGGMYISSYVTVTMNGSSTISGNTADDSAGTGYGGGIQADSYNTVTLNDDATVTGNTSGWHGGGLKFYYGNNSLVLNDRSMFSNNTASMGGGIHVYDGKDNTVTLNDDAQVSGNHATTGTDKLGGGLYFEGDGQKKNILFMHGNSKVTGNDAGKGAGVYLRQFLGILMDGTSTISSNVASVNGGGVFIESWANTTNNKIPTVTVTGSATITGNTAVQGGAIFGIMMYNPNGLPGAVVAPAGAITGNTPGTEQCKGTDKPNCV